MSNEVTAYEPRNIGELETFANRVVRTQLVPQAYRNRPDDAMVAMMYGKETAGLGPLASLQFVAVINGRPAFYGDALPGIAFNKGMIVDMEESFEGKPYDEDFTAVCIVTRPSGSKVTQRFSVGDAKKAGLWGKSGPWSQFPKRMMQWRARSWAIRDAAPHLLFGPTYEELTDQPAMGADRALDVTPRTAAPLADPADTVAVYDEFGQEEMLSPAEVGAWAKARATEATDEGLEELLAQNGHAPAVLDAVEAEKARRAAKASRALPLFDADGVEVGTYTNATDWLANLELYAVGDALPALVSANGGLLRRLAEGARTPADLKLRAADLLEQAEAGEVA